MPASGTWQILNSTGTVVGSSATTNGWSVSYSSGTNDFTIAVPTSALAAAGYEVKYASVGSADFSVLSASMTGSGITQYTWDQYGNLLTRTNARGVTRTNHYVYSNFALGELTSTQDSYVSGGTTYYKTATTITYDDSDGYTDAHLQFHPCGLITNINSPTPGSSGGTGSQVTTSFAYDVSGQGAKPMGQLGLGSLVTLTEPGNNAASSVITTFNYTTDGTYSQSAACGECLTAADNSGHVTHMRYDARGNLSTLIDALGNQTTITYTLRNSPLATTYPATGQTGVGNSVHVRNYLYSSSTGDPTQQFGPIVTDDNYNEGGTLVRQISHTFGAEGEQTSSTGGTEPQVIVYDALYRTSSLVDGNGNTTTYSYNPAGYLARINYPGSGSATSGSDTVESTSYDGYGNITQRVDGRGIVTNYAYNDPERKLTSVTYPASPAINVSYVYDGFGRTYSMLDGTGTTTYSYDDTDRRTKVVSTYSGLPAETLTYGFYNDGSVSTLSTPAGNFNYNYDASERITSLTNPYGETSLWTYQDNDWVSSQTLGNGVVSHYTYNSRGYLTDLLNETSAGTTLSEFGSMTYNGIGDQTSIGVSVPSQPSYSGSTNYSYDALGTGGTRSQLAGEVSTRIGGYSEANTYDNAKNPTDFRSSSVPASNSDNQTAASGYSFDGNGNATTFNGYSLSFDSENRMTSFGSVLTATYRGDNLRASKTNATSTTYFLYDGYCPVVELNSSGAVTAVNTFAPTGLLSRYSGGSSTFYTFDQQGNTAQRLTSSGTILDTSAFDGFGLRTSTGTNTDPYGGYGSQAGYYTDTETQLEYCTYRYYSPLTGRFITRDPSGYYGGINLYCYVQNNPLSGHDFFGLSPDTAPWPWQVPPTPQPSGCTVDPNNPCWVNVGAAIGSGLGAWGGAEGGALLGGSIGAVGGPPGIIIGGLAGGIIGAIGGGYIGGAAGGLLGGIMAPKPPGAVWDPTTAPAIACSDWWFNKEMEDTGPVSTATGAVGSGPTILKIIQGALSGGEVPL